MTKAKAKAKAAEQTLQADSKLVKAINEKAEAEGVGSVADEHIAGCVTNIKAAHVQFKSDGKTPTEASLKIGAAVVALSMQAVRKAYRDNETPLPSDATKEAKAGHRALRRQHVDNPMRTVKKRCVAAFGWSFADRDSENPGVRFTLERPTVKAADKSDADKLASLLEGMELAVALAIVSKHYGVELTSSMTVAVAAAS